MHTQYLLTVWQGGIKSKRSFQDEAKQIGKCYFPELAPVSSGLGKGGKRIGESDTLLVKRGMDPSTPNTEQKGQRVRNKSVHQRGGGEREKEKDPKSITS